MTAAPVSGRAHGFRVPRRIVTGHDAAGVSVVVGDGPVPVSRELPDDGVAFHEVWVTAQSPAVIGAGAEDPTAGALTVPPPAHGTRIRVNEFLPGHLDEHGRQSPVHRTESVDYGIVLEGEITLILDDSEVVARAGDIVVQRGTDHAWANRTDAVARVAFVLVGGEFGPDVLEVLPADVRGGLMRHGPREQDAGGAA
ncbi:MAG TPA: cupin domain-containing protein [Microbacterium sp.]|uniref:cupin domain-containing protein n=1 Tax=Microbacterium sp. TaxID=51671 RepID=UPI002B47F9A9|nr:cupin domain-containing protein [Microbacterium sp.]HKT56517.1 cupin domain-containing protein [Microbacterium sp.]